MRFSKIKNFSAFLSLSFFLIAISSQAADYPEIDYSKVDNSALVRKGEYLAKASDCIACHTDSLHGGKAFAGGLGLETPFGAFYSPNITADKKTGIGNWSDADFIAAVRHGAGPGGNKFPVFPYLYYNKMSDEDVLAIKAYLFAVPKVEAEPPANTVPWPFSVRFMQYGWKLLFFYPYSGVYQFNPNQTKIWNRGAYLVEGPAHCGMCHSPLNLLGAEKRKYRYTGGFVQGYYAPDITSVGLKKYSVAQIVSVLHDGKTLSGKGGLSGPMKEAYSDSFKYLSVADDIAIATYLKSLVSEEPKNDNQIITAHTGSDIYNQYCSSCHMNGGNGAPVFGDKAAWESRMKVGLNTVIAHAINGIGSMPAMGNCARCSQQQIQATVEYMVKNSLSSSKASASPVKDYYYKLPQVSPSQGKILYEEHCAVCHNAHTDYKYAPKIGEQDKWADILAQKNFDELLNEIISGKNDQAVHTHPVNGGCSKCSTPEIIAATKYLVQQEANGQYDFSLW